MFSLILAPSMKYMLFYLLVFYVYQAQLILRHIEADERTAYLVTWLLFGIFIFCFWFIFQKRELKRFFQMSKAEMKEKEAIEESN